MVKLPLTAPTGLFIVPLPAAAVVGSAHNRHNLQTEAGCRAVGFSVFLAAVRG